MFPSPSPNPNPILPTMPFDSVDPKQSLPDLEHGILKYWKEEDTFKRSISQRRKSDTFTDECLFNFYDGPPFATGLPHYGHLLVGTIKDVIPRYQTMRGKYIERRFGWDCHGLPIENLIEKEHAITDHKQIEAMGIDKFNALCRNAVQRCTEDWRRIVERTGRWVDMDWDYRTMDPDYMESMWWAFQKLHEKGVIYEGNKPMHVCPRCVTPLSNFEVGQGYKDVTDTAVTVKFHLKETKGNKATKETKDTKNIFLLAWTTTPWTLPGNLFLAVNPEVEYVKFMQKDDEKTTFIASRNYLEKVLEPTDGRTIDEKKYLRDGASFKGKELRGLTYEPLFPYFKKQYSKKAFRIVEGDFVTTDDGTGIVHIAPGFGEDDYAIGKREKVDVLQHVTMDGKFIDDVTDFAGMDVKPKNDPSKTDRAITEWLEKNGKLSAQEKFRHTYPHCWRCDSPLLNYATSSWFVAVEKLKEKMLENNAKTQWVPAHVRDGRYGNWLKGARDWAISRNRYWGTPLPIWRNAKDIEVIGSRDDLMRHHQIRFTKITALRHGESEGNLIPIYQGHTPGTDLTERGRAQAEATALSLKDQNVSAIYASPLARTKQTAEAIAKLSGAPLIIDERLREVEFGEYEGKHIDFTDLTFIKERRAKKIEEQKPESIFHFPGMETWDSVQKRVKDFLQDILPRHRSDHIVIVSHADPIQNIRHFFTHEDPIKIGHQPYPTYATPSIFYWDHDRGEQMDLHKEYIDDIAWTGSENTKESVHLTLVRHGETDWNKEGKTQGHEDIPLNATGRKEAEALAEELHNVRFDGIVTSDLSRAKETADILSKKLKIPILEVTELLRERKFGEWEGKSKEDLLAKHSLSSTNVSFHHHTPKHGESLSAFLKRLQQVCDHVLKNYAGKHILLVAHSGTLQGLSALTENLSYAECMQGRIKTGSALSLTINPLLRRIPEVLDCWFESGSMPFAQQHFPFEFEHRSRLEPIGFPADFIGEAVEQSRTWFYTLMVLSTALFDETPFKNVVVNGIVLAEDGKKMSKRLKNYPDPMGVVEKYGADALRFALMYSPVVRGEDIRFCEKLVEEAVRNVLLPLWNSYSFFVTYANACAFQHTTDRRASRHPLDLWIQCEIQDLINRMTQQLDAYDLSATCTELFETIDALTNWYIRLSRKRFAGKEGNEEDREEALQTLYDVLLTLSQLLAPFCPFMTEAIYLNLVSTPHGSVHLTDWPLPRALSTGEKLLLDKTRTMRTIVSLGLSIRGEKVLKLRQPLHKATVALPPALAEHCAFSKDDIDLMRMELNVKELAFTDHPEELADVIAQVDARKVGPRLGSRVQEIIKAGKEGDFEVEEDGRIRILDELLAPDEASIVYRAKEGLNVAASKGIVVSLDTTLTEELELEGRARDLIRAIQRLRKESGLELHDRITLSITGAKDILQHHEALITEGTNATLGETSQNSSAIDLDGTKVTICFEKR